MECESESGLNLNNLPPEIIIEIISHLHNFNDLLNAMLISKNIRDVIFNTQKFMWKIRFVFYKDYDILCFFLSEKGRSIIYLKFRVPVSDFEDILPGYLQLMPNLEELELIHDVAIAGIKRKLAFNTDSHVELPKLKKFVLGPMQFDNDVLKYFMNINSLESFVYGPYAYNDSKLVTKFLSLQTNLKELSIENSALMYKDITNDVKFKHDFLDFREICYSNKNFLKFLQSQAGSLKKIKCCGMFQEGFAEYIFDTFKNLEYIITSSYKPCIYEIHPYLTSNSVKHFEDISNNQVHIPNLCAKFPNLESLKCLKIFELDNLEFIENLTSLEIENFHGKCFQNLIFLNLKTLTFKNFIREDDSMTYWEDFVENHPGIENLSIDCIEDSRRLRNFYEIMESLIDFENLKTFKYNSLRYTIHINTEKKFVKTSNYIAKGQKCKKFLELLKAYFNDFKFSIIEIIPKVKYLKPEVNFFDPAEPQYFDEALFWDFPFSQTLSPSFR